MFVHLLNKASHLVEWLINQLFHQIISAVHQACQFAYYSLGQFVADIVLKMVNKANIYE
jgi:hypothetical protein